MKDSWNDDNILIERGGKEITKFCHEFQNSFKASLQHFFENYNEHSQSIEASLNDDTSFRQSVVRLKDNEHNIEGWVDVVGRGARLVNQHMGNPTLASKAAMSGVSSFLCSRYLDVYRGSHTSDTYRDRAYKLHSEVTKRGIHTSNETEWLLPPRSSLSEQDKKGIDIVTLVGVAGHDSIMGTKHDDKLYGGSGNDLLRGREGNDILYGGEGHDNLNGGIGNDELIGEANNDLLQGGSGSDIYHFRSGDGNDIITECKRTPDDVDILRFGSGILPEQVILQRSHVSSRNDLTLKIRNSDDSVTIKDFFGQVGPQVERVEFSDGSHWNMAAFAQKYGGVGDINQIHLNIIGGALGQNHCVALEGSSTSGVCDERFDDIKDISRSCLTGEKSTVTVATLQHGDGDKTVRYGHGMAPADVTLTEVKSTPGLGGTYYNGAIHSSDFNDGLLIMEIKGVPSHENQVSHFPARHNTNITEFYDGTVWTSQDIRKHFQEGTPLPTAQPAVPNVGGSVPQLHQDVVQFMAAGEEDDASVSSVSLPLATASSHQNIQQSSLAY